MPSRNRVPNAAELVSRSLNWTSGVSPCDRSVISNASRHCLLLQFTTSLPPQPDYDEQIIACPGARVQLQALIWFPSATGLERNGARGRIVAAQKKSRRFRRLLKLITGRRQTEWTGATRCPK